MRKSVERRERDHDVPATYHAFYARRYTRLILPIAGLVAVAAIGGLVYYQSTESALAQQQAESQQKLADANVVISRLKTERLAREKAAKDAADQAAQLAVEVAKDAAAAPTTPSINGAQSAVCNFSTGEHDDPTRIDVVVNKKHCIVPVGYVPSQLATSYGATLTAEASDQFTALVEGAAAQGISISASSSYRSYAAQVATYNHWVAVNGSIAAADQVSARPGYSEHQTGLAVDVSSNGCSLDCFASSPAYTWMQSHAAEYGFIERYPSGLTSITGYSPEAWHYRYVGVAVAKDMKNTSVKTLEQYWNVAGGDY